jgi:hypothetical protein
VSDKRQVPDEGAPDSQGEAVTGNAEVNIRVARPLYVGKPLRLEAKSLTPGYAAQVAYAGSGLHSDRSVTLHLSLDITSPPGEVPPFSAGKENP